MSLEHKKIRIHITDDHQLFREGLRLLLMPYAEYEICGEAANGVELLEFLEQQELPDIVLLDIAMPEMDGISTARIALERHPKLKIITLSMYDQREYYDTLFEIGAKGFLLKDSEIDELLGALEAVAGGESYFSKTLLSSIALDQRSCGNNSEETKEHENILSEREREITTLICQGLTTCEIADGLCISRRTVDKHRENILIKTGAKNTANLVVYAIKNGILEI